MIDWQCLPQLQAGSGSGHAMPLFPDNLHFTIYLAANTGLRIFPFQVL